MSSQGYHTCSDCPLSYFQAQYCPCSVNLSKIKPCPVCFELESFSSDLEVTHFLMGTSLGSFCAFPSPFASQFVFALLYKSYENESLVPCQRVVWVCRLSWPSLAHCIHRRSVKGLLPFLYLFLLLLWRVHMTRESSFWLELTFNRAKLIACPPI